MVEVRGLRKSFRRPDGAPVEAVKGIDLDIYKGEIFSLLGPNGAGKTTVVSMISGLLPPTAGDARIGGHSITKEPMAAKRLIGFIPQEIALYPELNARQNLAFFGKMYGLSGKELDSRIDEVLEFIDLTDRQKDRVDTFSGGMKRRVNIGVGLLHRPQLLYMDEPTAGIDPQNRRRILDTVKQLRSEEGVTILYTTHLMEEAQELSDRVGIIDHGEIIALGAQEELTQQVGQEDRLEFMVSCQSWVEGLTAQLEEEVEGLSYLQYTPPEELEDRSDGLELSRLSVYAKRGRQALPDIIRIVNGAGVDVYSVEVREPDLEAVFLALTGRALRD
ncbi:MAG: ABC transporter ATP-binding protein [Caldilineaceae bacterium]|nr:ABC transporter ATP-binding protein [Caldilineaceae bacterium]